MKTKLNEKINLKEGRGRKEGKRRMGKISSEKVKERDSQFDIKKKDEENGRRNIITRKVRLSEKVNYIRNKKRQKRR